MKLAALHNPGPWALVLIVATTIACAPSPFLLQKYAAHDFTTEGFLTPNMLQTIGSVQLDRKESLAEPRRVCLERALNLAVERALRVMLHTHFELGIDRTGKQSQVTVSRSFENDYPFPLTKRDYLRARIEFRPLLRKGYIALQDARNYEGCRIVFRIDASDLPARIRAQPLTFRPELYKQRGRPDLERRKRQFRGEPEKIIRG